MIFFSNCNINIICFGCIKETNDTVYKTYVVGTQKNRLDETVLMSTQNKYLN